MQPVAAALPHQVAVLEAHGAMLLDDRRGRPAHCLDPGGHLLGVRHRGGQADELDRRVEVDDHLLPDGAAVPVLQVVHLVEHDRPQPLEGGRGGVDHVAEHLGRHHHDRCVAVDGVVTGEQTHPVRAVHGGEVGVFLVRERLQRRRVEGLAARGEGTFDGVLGDDGLARAGRRGDEHVLPRVEGVECPLLERVEGKPPARLEADAEIAAGGCHR